MEKNINLKSYIQRPRTTSYSLSNPSYNYSFQINNNPFNLDLFNNNSSFQQTYYNESEYIYTPRESTINQKFKYPNHYNSIDNVSFFDNNLISYDNSQTYQPQNEIYDYNSSKNSYIKSYNTITNGDYLSNEGNIYDYAQDGNSTKYDSFSFNNIFLEPDEKLILSQFELKEEIGKGTYGSIYKTKWKLNNKYYAIKREKLKDINEVIKRENTFKIIKDFLKKTNCNGIITMYSNLYFQKGIDYRYYELMEMCDKDFEHEIKERAKYSLFYTENELRNIMYQLITTLACLQKNHITHRDIKPQNILIVKGKYKLGDFGEVRAMQREGIVIQRVRGSELFMSPILFYGYQNSKVQVRHNTYKSDVFSLGMCLFFAADLSYNGPVEIREVLNLNKMKEILNNHLSFRYSQKLINILLLMLQIEEKNRPDFILLEDAIKKFGF